MSATENHIRFAPQSRHLNERLVGTGPDSRAAANGISSRQVVGASKQ
jgi:hypothetical protein